MPHKLLAKLPGLFRGFFPGRYPIKGSRSSNSTMPMLAVAIVLILMSAFFTNRNIRMNEDAVSALLTERANTMFDSFNSALETAADLPLNNSIQAAVADLASREHVLFVALVQENGQILAHSNPQRVGDNLYISGRPVRESVSQAFNLGNGLNTGQGIMPVEGGLSFVAQRALPGLDSSPTAHLIIGQDAGLLRQMQAQNYRSAIYSGLIVLLTGLTAVIIIRFLENGSEARRKLQVAETIASQMVNEVKRLEKQVRLQEKMAAIGDLAAGVAHEIRNPLSSIKGYATYFSTRFPLGSEDREAALVMVQEAERLNRVISDLIGVSRPTDIHRQVTDLGRLAEETIRLLSPDAVQRSVSLRLEAEPVRVLADPDRLRQALLNVCLNAVEAMAQGGALTISVLRQQNNALLRIVDNGPGIAPEILSRIFDPYFTTKNQGTGLGLAMVLKIVDAHDGTIKVTSEHGQGTSVEISLPLNLPDNDQVTAGERHEPAINSDS